MATERKEGSNKNNYGSQTQDNTSTRESDSAASQSYETNQNFSSANIFVNPLFPLPMTFFHQQLEEKMSPDRQTGTETQGQGTSAETSSSDNSAPPQSNDTTTTQTSQNQNEKQSGNKDSTAEQSNPHGKPQHPGKMEGTTGSTTSSDSSTNRPNDEKSSVPEKTSRIRLPITTIDKRGKATKAPALVTLPEEEELSERAAMAPLLSMSGNNDMPPRDGDGQQQPTDSDLTIDADQPHRTLCTRICNFYKGNEFVILVLASILLARAYPPLGARYVAPKITAGWIYVMIIFILAGLSLKTEEFSKAFQQIWFNLYFHMFNFGIVSSSVYAGCLLLVSTEILSQDLADGMVVCSCLPTTINMIIVLAKAAGGDESLAVVNAAAGNMIGVFLSPVLILGYLGVKGDIKLYNVFYKLALRVVLPVVVGQVMQKTMPRLMAYHRKHKKQFRKFQEYCLTFIVYTVFCRTFENGADSSIREIFIMILFVFLFLVTFMAAAWISSGILFPDQPEMRIVGLFGCTHKTVSMGVPVINAIYEDSPALGLYTLPLLIWHPMQLVLGSFLAPYLDAFVQREKIRLGREEDDSSSYPDPRLNRREKEDSGGAVDFEDVEGRHGGSVELSTSQKSKLGPKGTEFSRISSFEPGSGQDYPS